MDNKQIINKWFGLLVDNIMGYDDTIKIQDIYKLVENTESIDILDSFYRTRNSVNMFKDWVGDKSESSIEKILEKRGVKYLKKQVGSASNYLFFLNDDINFYTIDKRPHSIFLNIFNAKTSKLENYIDISDYKELAMYIDKLMINMKNEIKVDTERWMYERDKYPMIKTAKCGIGESSLGYYFTYEPVVEVDGKDISIKDGDILVLENDKVVEVYKN